MFKLKIKSKLIYLNFLSNKINNTHSVYITMGISNIRRKID